MTSVTNVQRRNREPLIEGTKMRCPRCKQLNNILSYIPMMEIEEFATETNPIYKCGNCRWMFSPAIYIDELFPKVELGDKV